jgi:heme O synthase-like polyprenyltransferase
VPDDPRGSSEESERSSKDLDRELIELLNELRVALPGVQVLFAFLLTVPFTNRFNEVTAFQKDVYFAALLCALFGSVLLIAPSTYHRIRWRQRDKEQMLRTANRLAISGTVFLALGMCASILLITDVLFSIRSAAIATGITAGAFTWFWYGLPLLRRVED